MANNQILEQVEAIRDRRLAVISAVQIEHKGEARI